MNLFVSNIDFKIDENELKSIFEKFGKVKSLKILTDPDSAKSLGYGFVKMGSEYEGQKAIIRLNNKLFRKRKLSVQERQDPNLLRLILMQKLKRMTQQLKTQK